MGLNAKASQLENFPYPKSVSRVCGSPLAGACCQNVQEAPLAVEPYVIMLNGVTDGRPSENTPPPSVARVTPILATQRGQRISTSRTSRMGLRNAVRTVECKEVEEQPVLDWTPTRKRHTDTQTHETHTQPAGLPHTRGPVILHRLVCGLVCGLVCAPWRAMWRGCLHRLLSRWQTDCCGLI